jgi:hypothetical protein
MPLVRFTQNIQRHVPCPDLEVAGGTVREVLEAYFSRNGQARGYVLDDRDSLRRHMAVYVDGRPLADTRDLSDPVTEESTLDVIQALSGG